MADIIAKLQNILGVDDDKLPNLMAYVFLQIKEDQVSREIPKLAKIINPLAEYTKNSDENRVEIVFGLFCHIQILRVQAELAGMDNFDKSSHDKCIIYLLKNKKNIRDGIAQDDSSDGRMTKEMIKQQIKSNVRSQVPPPSQASSSNPPPAPYQRNSDSFIVAVPK
jgi:hypothetical protein